MGGLHIDEKIVGLSISQWLPCPLAIWNLSFGMAILLNLVKHSDVSIIQRSIELSLKPEAVSTIF